jgi:hypothetical protein
MSEENRVFDTGATRSPLGTKPEYAGFISPLVIKRFGEYMHKHRTQADGKVRSADNWQKNIDMDSLNDSKIRHDMDIWLHSRGYSEEAAEPLEEALCACMFNTMAILKQVLEQSGRGLNGLAMIQNPIKYRAQTP